jgi:hypothetical protein
MTFFNPALALMTVTGKVLTVAEATSDSPHKPVLSPLIFLVILVILLLSALWGPGITTLTYFIIFP